MITPHRGGYESRQRDIEKAKQERGYDYFPALTVA